MGDIFSGGAGIVTGLLDRGAAQDAENKQTDALKQMMDRISRDLDPNVVNEKALQGDIARAKARLTLQGEVDPELLAQRRVAEQILSKQLGQLGGATSDTVAARAAEEALGVSPKAAEAKNALIDAALEEIRLGASIPPDIQAELMQAGLQQAGQVTGGATARGAGGTILQQVLGLGGLQLKQQRETQAANLLTSASNLEAQRQQILQNLFPRLQEQQLQNIKGAAGVLELGNQMLPEAGLSGSDIANVWLSRVGALNQLSGQMGNVLAQGVLAKQGATDKAIGSGAQMVGGIASGVATGGASNILSSILGSKTQYPDTGYKAFDTFR